MNNLTSISEYQKIVFVKGLNELSNQFGEEYGGIAGLSEAYPFAVFLTKYPNDTDTNNIDGNYPITNLWFDGQRLTRFIGIDKNNSTINIGEHTIQLVFDYETGLLRICDANTLKSISVEKCTFVDINGNQQTLNEVSTSDNPYLIDAKNNEFVLSFKYIPKNKDNINNISKKLSYNNNSPYFSEKENSGESININNDNFEETYELYKYTYVIKESTHNNAGNKVSIKYNSIYANNIGGNFYLSLRLNPIGYNIIIDNQIVNDSITLVKGQTYTINVNFDPSNITSYTDFFIRTSIITDSDKVLIIGQSVNTIIDGSCYFNIKISDDIQANTTITCNLSFEVWRYIDNNSEGERYNYLDKTISINASGDQTDKYFYFGYIDPLSEDFDTNLISYCENAGEEIIYEGGLLDNTNVTNEDYFYCLIPTTYINTIKPIKPRWDAYTVNSLGEKEYVDCLNWFNVSYGNKSINGINFTIYKRIQSGKFYGKIK